jgi:hypothetical protein
MKTKDTYYFIPTFIKYELTVSVDTVPGVQGYVLTQHDRYMVAFLDNIWPLKDRDINPWIMPAIGAVTVIFGILYFSGLLG